MTSPSHPPISTESISLSDYWTGIAPQIKSTPEVLRAAFAQGINDARGRVKRVLMQMDNDDLEKALVEPGDRYDDKIRRINEIN